MDLERFAGTEKPVKSVRLIDPVKPGAIGGPVGKRVNIRGPLDAVRPVRLQGPMAIRGPAFALRQVDVRGPVDVNNAYNSALQW